MRTFTLDEAHWLLPSMREQMKRCMEGKKMIDEVDAEFAALTHRVFLMGGMLLQPAHLSRRRAERDAAAKDVQLALTEIDEEGVQVKDLDIGLLDFPCEFNGEIILLCWKFGEEAITHYHSLEEGFRGRKPITDEIRFGFGRRSQ